MAANPAEALVLSYLGLRREASVPELSGHLRVPSSTVVGIVSRLERQGLVFRLATVHASRGRPRIIYRMRLPGPVLACTLDGTELYGALVTPEIEAVAVRSISATRLEDADYAVRLIAELCGALRDAPSSRGICPVGLGLSINAVQTEQRVLMSSVLPWATEELATSAGRALGLPAVLVSASEVFAWAAYQAIPAPVPDSAVYLNVSDGVSAHAVIGGKVFAGASSLAGELGHVIVERGGPLCGCGQRGCLETFCSGPAIRAAILAGLRSGVSTTLDLKLVEREAPRELLGRVFDAWASGDTFAVSVMDPVLERLGWALGIVLNLLDPACVVVGGYVLHDRQAWVDELIRRAERWTLRSSSRATRVTAGTPDRAGVLRVVASRYFYDPAAWGGSYV